MAAGESSFSLSACLRSGWCKTPHQTPAGTPVDNPVGTQVVHLVAALIVPPVVALVGMTVAASAETTTTESPSSRCLHPGHWRFPTSDGLQVNLQGIGWTTTVGETCVWSVTLSICSTP